MVSEEFIKSEYPLHWLVWHNEYKLLEKALATKEHDKEKNDNRGRTPLMLAVTLGHLESTRTLLNAEANVNCENNDGWNVVQEAVATGDPELVHIVLERRDLQRYTNRMAGIPGLLQKLKEAPDFYVEMKWEFTSWVPLVPRMCPSDTYKVYKQGSNVRIDTTLLGFDHTSWQRGNRSYVFQGQSYLQFCPALRGYKSYVYRLISSGNGDDGATMMEIDHDLRQVYCEEMRSSDETLGVLLPNEETVSQRLTTPIITTYVDTDKISFERNKAGIWGWRSDKNENVNGHDCKVFSATNVELVTKTRTEHLTETDKARSRHSKTPLQNFLGIAEVGESAGSAGLAQNEEYTSSTNPSNITPEEYFDGDFDLGNRDIGRPKETSVKIQKFKANLWLCEDYPLSLPEQILPIVDLMAISSSHFAKLKDFIQMQLPSGFPVKIEIPLFHVLNARITFGNIFATDGPVPKVSTVQEEDRLACVLDDSLFLRPAHYTQIGVDARRQFSMEEEDDLLQFAIQQSLVDSGTEREEVDIWEALRAQRPSRPDTPNTEERELQRAIQASLEQYQGPPPAATNVDPDIDYDLQMALEVSERERELEERRRKEREEEMMRDEEKMLERALELSLTEK
ncbi:ankyrin repeat domain-containing protein 13D isoform X2 [Cylas formicarius]|uniref:ankyrin repeat domain-containing protein 13D isoform X2 n=1 Tax=Cylas formicarius TaxID=197179 RepID=UPI00295840C0|nr:ankyrin repeat domain-containing protein 13D isoform X2 [Cylas formicarius]